LKLRVFSITSKARVPLGALLLAAGLSGCGDDDPPPGPVGPAPETVPIRRLTNTEYRNSVAALFPGRTLPDISFVADGKVVGFTNFSSAQTSSLVRTEQYVAAAEAIAAAVTTDPTALTGCDAAAQGERGCVEPYLYDLGKRAYRRPLNDLEKQALFGLFADRQDQVPYATRLGLAIQGVLLSPKFLFRPEVGDRARTIERGTPLTPYEVATRLSFLIAGSIPDAELMASAGSGKLSRGEEVARQATRLLAMPESQAHLVHFHQQWLGIDSISALAKDPQPFPNFTPLLAYYMGEETRRFLSHVLFEKQGSYADLLLTPYTFVTADLAAFYGVPAPATEWGQVDLDPGKRLGILTQASLLATMAKSDQTDPVRRGKFVLQQILCRNIPSPSAEIVAMFKPLDLSKTARDQFTQHRENPVCNSCHMYLDPLGLPFEHYDGAGQWRDTDRSMPIDATGSIDGQPFDGVPALAQLLVDKAAARACYGAQWFRNAVGRLEENVDQPYLDWLAADFSRDTRIVDLIVRLVTSDNFRYLKADPGPSAASQVSP
jgi:hypothetical protein